MIAERLDRAALKIYKDEYLEAAFGFSGLGYGGVYDTDTEQISIYFENDWMFGEYWDMIYIHESIHNIADNFNNEHRATGIIYDDKEIMRGLNECCTEYLCQLACGKVNAMCAYSAGVERLKTLIDAGIFTEDELITAYFNNDISYFKRRIKENGGNFNKIIEIFDKAHDGGNPKAMDELDKEIAKLIGGSE